MRVKYYKIGLELMINGKAIEHIEYEEETDLAVAYDIYDTWSVNDRCAKYIIAVTEDDNEIELASKGYKGE